MLLMVACGLLLVAGVAVVIVWGGERFALPEDPPARATAPTGSARPRLRRHLAGLRFYIWWASLFLTVGTASGILITGAGGRLIMRALAATSPHATGRLTEAQAVVGDISLNGTLAYLVFGALPFAFLSTALYLLCLPWLPRGRLAGALFGALLFIAVAPFIDPLRADNIDFHIVGPGWLAVTLFALLALLQGAALAALSARLSRSLPLLTRSNWPAAGSPLLLAVLFFPIGVVVALGAIVTFALPRALPWFLTACASRTGVLVGRILLAGAVLAALPAFIGAVVTIWGR